jgi:hypothetical protein
MHDDVRERHPAFGQIRVSKVHHGGATRLYGTPLEFHPTTVVIAIKRSERSHGLSHDRYFGRDQLIEIEMSGAQFTEILMSMNHGDGVPCTIRRVQGEGMVPAIPFEDKTEVERIEEVFSADVEDLNEKVSKMTDRAREILGQPRLRKADKEELLGLMTRIQRFYYDNSPFVMKSFRESVQRGVNIAKRELDTFVNVLAGQTGIEALRQLSVPDQIRRLTGRPAEDADDDPGK